jgi:hypothetical protein
VAKLAKKARQQVEPQKSLQKDSVVIEARWAKKSAVIFLFAYDLVFE